jgi:hypothetical protein
MVTEPGIMIMIACLSESLSMMISRQARVSQLTRLPVAQPAGPAPGIVRVIWKVRVIESSYRDWYRHLDS